MSAEAARPSRGPIVALVIAVGAVLSSWNPFAAPIGLILGIAVAWAALRMLASKRGSRQLAVWALALGGIALAISAVVLLLSAGALSATPPGQATMSDRTPDEVNRMLDDAQQRTAAARKRAGGELDQVLPIKPGGSSARDSAAGKRRDQQKSTTVAE